MRGLIPLYTHRQYYKLWQVLSSNAHSYWQIQGQLLLTKEHGTTVCPYRNRGRPASPQLWRSMSTHISRHNTTPAHQGDQPHMSSHIDNYKTTPAHKGAQPHTACSPKRAVRLTPNAPAEKQHQTRTKNILFNLTILTFIQDFSRTYCTTKTKSVVTESKYYNVTVLKINAIRV